MQEINEASLLFFLCEEDVLTPPRCSTGGLNRSHLIDPIGKAPREITEIGKWNVLPLLSLSAVPSSRS